jgi:toxin CcdB
MSSQFDVHPNPDVASRPRYPWVVIVQSDLVDAVRTRLVAPLAPEFRFPRAPGRVTPRVVFSGEAYVAVVPSLAALPAGVLRGAPVATLADQRASILSAVDLLFFGI